MGGQLNYFGLWIGADNFGEGHSKASPLSSTYRSPQLSNSEQFTIEEMEGNTKIININTDIYSILILYCLVWCVQERYSDEDDPQQSSTSVLDRNPDVSAIFEMAGRTMYSKLVRDPDLDLNT
jgi:hypothetical protein